MADARSNEQKKRGGDEHPIYIQPSRSISDKSRTQQAQASKYIHRNPKGYQGESRSRVVPGEREEEVRRSEAKEYQKSAAFRYLKAMHEHITP